MDVLDEQAADIEVERITLEHTTNDVKKVVSDNQNDNFANSRGDAVHKIHIVRHAPNESERITTIEDTIRSKFPFKGTYATYVRDDRRIAIPDDYQKLLEFGGVVTYSNDKHLLLFGKFHWQRMEQLITKDLGMDVNRDILARHFYRGKMDFDKLNDDGTLTLTKSLTKYAGIKDKAIMIGVVYFAEIHSLDNWEDSKLDAREISKISSALA